MKCMSCGNEYKKPLKIFYRDKEYIVDSFECAINLLAPVCQQCGCKIIGHGIESDENIFCCTHCLRSAASHANEKMVK